MLAVILRQILMTFRLSANPVAVIIILLLLYGCIRHHENDEIKFYKDGTIKSIKRINNGLLEGESLWFYSNGNLERKMTFRNGKANGNAYFFYKSGAIYSHKYYNNDSLSGFVTDYYEDTVGLIKNVMRFENGKPIEGKFEIPK
jgi:antitoxin component YwqK of YwqJK toxin-antitoxin module